LTEPTQPGFYKPWPLFGRKLSNQWDESRYNSEVLAVLAQAAGFDLDDPLGNSDLMSWELGQHNFHNRFRFVYDDSGTSLKLQKNAGTEISPIWVDAVTVDYETLLVSFANSASGGFYLNVKTTDPSRTFATDTLIFNKNQFYLDSNSAGKPIVSLVSEGGSGTPGISSITVNTTVPPQTFATDTITFDKHDFYLSPSSTGKPVVSLNNAGTSTGISSITVKTTVPLPTFSTGTVIFDRDDFYISPNSAGLPIISLAAEEDIDIDINTTALVVKTTVPLPTFTTDTLIFDRGDFYISPNSAGKPIVSLNQSSASSGSGNTIVVAGVQSQSFSSSVEWQFNHNLASRPLLWSIYNTNFEAILPDKLDISNPNIAYFYFVDALAGTAIVSSGRTSVDITGGFYGMSIRNNPITESFKNINLISFDSASFYLTQNAPNRDEVLVSLKDDITGFVHKTGDQMTGTLKVGTIANPVQIQTGNLSGNTSTNTARPPYSFNDNFLQGVLAGVGYYETFFNTIPSMFFSSGGTDLVTLTNNSLFIPNSPYLYLSSASGLQTGIFGAKYIQLIGMTSANRDSATFLTPTDGMIIYNTTTGTIQARLAGVWTSL
jgi:hypothetical protein